MIQELSGPWHLAMDPANRGREEKWFKAVHPEAREASVPGIIQQVFPDTFGVAWYWCAFKAIRSTIPNARYHLRFGAVDYLAEVWLNGRPAGGHEGGETPFSLDVTQAIRPARVNLLAVRVLNPTDDPIDGIRLSETPHRNKEQKNYQPGRSYNYGGILLPVELQVVPPVRITDIFARPQWNTGDIPLTLTLANDGNRTASRLISVSVAPPVTGEVLSSASRDVRIPPGGIVVEMRLSLVRPRPWSLEDPFLYQVRASIRSASERMAFDSGSHEVSVRCGFRDFRVERGYFHLNGKRLFLKSTHTGNHFPVGQVVPPNPDLMRRDFIYAKACGYNMVRFIAGVAWPEQLDFCDQIGLMVYEECLAGWCLADSPRMAERYDNNVREMVLRDRNHPSVTLWGLLNETSDGPVFRQAVKALSLVRSLDDTRLVLLGSGRWDCQPSVGSVSNPGSSVWEHVWGIESPGAPAVSSAWDRVHGGYFDRAGDAHAYPSVPHPPVTLQFIRRLGRGTRPVFLSEYGIGSLPNVIREWRGYEQARARPDLPDAALWRSMSEKLEADWKRLGMEGVYPFLEDFLSDSQRLHARQRRLGFDLIRSNPRICGFNLTGMLDHGMTGEGVWTFWREWKPEVFDAMRDGWAPLRWCLFVDPLHVYGGRPLKLEAVLANEDVLAPGRYPVCFRVTGPHGVAWERKTEVRLQRPRSGRDPAFAVPALAEEVVLETPPGPYELVANLESGGAPAGRRLGFFISTPPLPSALRETLTLWGIDSRVESWLRGRGMRTRPFRPSDAGPREILLVGDLARSPGDPARWQELARRVARGGFALFLSHQAFTRDEDPVGWLPLQKKGRCYRFNDWLYHKECVAKSHPIFDGLQAHGIMDWDYYGPVIPHHLFDGQETPEDVAAAAFAVGYCCPGGYASGTLVGVYRLGAGRFLLNTLKVLENIDVHPAADRLLLNMIRYAAGFMKGPPVRLPADFDARLKAVDYA
ncbi:MAG: hypothetical protein HYU36_23520 [Planctomycetes bacterium]|nr:hypothetical protein [Planctomycetota bacterium]